jgi:hypothetical protein
VEFQSFVFGQNWQFWAEFAALIMAESLPKVWLKSLKPHNSQTMNPNATWNVSLESYHPYLQSPQVSNTPQTQCIQSSLPKSAKSRFGCLGCLGVKVFVRMM